MTVVRPLDAETDTVYDTLVGDEPDLVGMVAYTLCNKAKREWITQHSPTVDERRSYNKTVTNTQIEFYRAQASNFLSIYADAISAELAQTMRKEAIDSAILAEVKRRNNFLINVGASVVGSVVFAVLLFGLAMALFSPAIKDVAAKVTEPTAPHANP